MLFLYHLMRALGCCRIRLLLLEEPLKVKLALCLSGVMHLALKRLYVCVMSQSSCRCEQFARVALTVLCDEALLYLPLQSRLSLFASFVGYINASTFAGASLCMSVPEIAAHMLCCVNKCINRTDVAKVHNRTSVLTDHRNLLQ